MAPHTKLNEYGFTETTAIIFLRYKDRPLIPSIIDLEDYTKVMEYTWQVSKQKDTFRVKSLIWNAAEGKAKNVSLHRFLINAPAGYSVDHINCDPLDNRKANLRLVSGKENAQNKKEPPSTNKSGVMCVSWNKAEKCYKAAIRKGGKYIFLGRFDDLDEAAEAVREARIVHMPFSQEAMANQI